MSAPQFTPGPWVAVLQNFRRLDAPEPFYTVGPSEFTTIADVRAGSDDDDLPKQVEGNAHLIAAAPDLLDAAKDALAGWRYIRQQHGDLYGVGWDRVEAALTAAIAKATGQDAAS